MAKVTIAQVDSKQLQKQFLNLPAKLHSNDPSWVPRLRATEKELCGFVKHPFTQISSVQAFVAIKNSQVAGRVLAIVNPVHHEKHPDQTTGFLGFFDCIDDHHVSEPLFEGSIAWLKAKGSERVRGPVSPSMNYEAGLLIRGFDKPPTFMMPYNPQYFIQLWKSAGFQKIQDMYAFRGNPTIYKSATKAWTIAQQAAERFGATFRQIDNRNFLKDVETFLRLYNSASSATWGFVPFSENEIQFLAKDLRHLISPELTSFMIIDGKTVGATFGLLDYSPIIKSIGGRLFPFGFLKILFGRNRIKKSRCMSINVLPEFQRWGLGLCLLDRFLQQGFANGVIDVEFSYVLESNHLAASTLTNAGVENEKTYRVYEKTI